MTDFEKINAVLLHINIDALTPRQRDVVSGLAAGLNAEEVARGLCIQHSTASTHIDNAKDASGAPSTYTLVAAFVLNVFADYHYHQALDAMGTSTTNNHHLP